MSQPAAGNKPARWRGGFPESNNKRMKEKAIAFYNEHKVPDALETLLNEMYPVRPDDVYGYMSEYFRKLSKTPVISSLSAHEVLDSNGGSSIDVDLHCTVCGVQKLTSSVALSIDMYLEVSDPQQTPTHNKAGGKGTPTQQDSSPAKKATKAGKDSLVDAVEGGGVESAEVIVDVVDAVDTVKKYVCKSIRGLPVEKQLEVDNALDKVNTEASVGRVKLHPSALLATSCAVASAGAQLLEIPLYSHLSNLFANISTTGHGGDDDHTDNLMVTTAVHGGDTAIENGTKREKSKLNENHEKLQSSGGIRKDSLADPELMSSSRDIETPHLRSKFTMPIPIASALAGAGMGGSGKLKFREFCLSPLPGCPFPKQIKILEKVHSELGKLLCSKSGAIGRCTLPNGAYCPTVDKPEQGLDMILDAAKNAGFQVDVDIGMLIDVGADMLYDQEKSKYELVTGQWKSTDDVINMYSDLLQSYPGLLGYVDPLHHTDIEGWQKLQDNLGSRCLLIADKTLEKGLAMKLPPSSQEPKQDSDTETQTSEHEQLKEPNEEETGEAETKEGGDEAGRDAIEDMPGLSYLSCASLGLQSTLSATIQKATDIKGHSHYIILRSPPNLTMNTSIADLSVAMRCRFLRLGGPCGVTSCSLLSQLLHIREELVMAKLHEPAKAHLFTCRPQTSSLMANDNK